MSSEYGNSLTLTDLQEASLSDMGSGNFEYIPDRKLYELLCSNFNKIKFESALKSVIENHPMLLSYIDMGDKCQIIDISQDLYERIEYVKLDKPVVSLPTVELNNVKDKIFRLECTPKALMNITVLYSGDNTAIVFILTDGTSIDGFSQEIIIRDLNLAYLGKSLKSEFPYAEYVKSMQNKKSTSEYFLAEEYWKKKIVSGTEPLQIPQVINDSKNSSQTFQLYRHISEEEFYRLNKFAEENGVTLFCLMLSVYCKVLGIYTKQSSFFINIPISFRPYDMEGIENTVGMCSDFMIFQYINKRKKTILETAQKVQIDLFEQYEYSLYSGTDVLKLMRNQYEKISIVPYTFTSLVDVEDYDDNSFRKIEARVETKNINIETIVSKCNQEVHITFTCRKDVIDLEMACNIADLYINTLKKVACDFQYGKTTDIGIHLRDAAIINGINDTDIGISKISLKHLLLNSFRKYKDKLAVADEQRGYTYDEFYKLVKKIIYAIDRVQKLESINAIGLYLNKSCYQIATSIAAIMSDCLYMPIEVSLPQEDIEYCIRSANISLIITEKCYEEKFKNSKVDILVLDSIKLIYEYVGVCSSDSRNKIIINTSGSTGRHKSVLLSEEGIVNCILHSKTIFHMDNNTRMLAITNYCHDMAIFDTLAILIYGGSIIVPNYRKDKEPNHWVKLIIRFKINSWNSVPALMDMLLLAEKSLLAEAVRLLKVVILGGEWVRITLINKIKNINPNVEIYSVGGPTETTIWNIVHRVTEEDVINKFVPYGVPFPNTKYYILHEDMQLAPIMVEGVMYVEGVGVSEGYIGNADETKKRFVVHKGRRLYNTGDCGRYLKNGEIQILGRMDSQVKIKGKRIELNGIENKINQMEGILECCVVLHKKGKNLAVFYTADKSVKENSVKEYITKNLVEYMIPSIIVNLSEMPLTNNGKPHRKKLERWELSFNKNKFSAHLPGFQMELLEMCKNILENPSIKLEDNFYLMGGDSISAIKLVTEIYHKYHIDMEVYDIMNRPYITEWVKMLNEKLNEEDIKSSKLLHNISDICKSFFGNNNINGSYDFWMMGGDEKSAEELAGEISRMINFQFSEFIILSRPYISDWIKEILVHS